MVVGIQQANVLEQLFDRANTCLSPSPVRFRAPTAGIACPPEILSDRGCGCVSSGQGILLIERRNPPLGWALPGFVDYGSVEQAALRRLAKQASMSS